MLVRHVALQAVSKQLFKLCNFCPRSNYSKNCHSDFEEITIKVPWGKLSGKLWSSEAMKGKQPILAVHGFMENAGTFDPLAPLLKTSPILAIDLPGHGYSSWLPSGVHYDDFVNIQTIRFVQKHFGWEKIKLMGQSKGAIICFKFTVTYPEDVLFLVNFDPLCLRVSDSPSYHKRIGQNTDRLLKFEAKVSIPPSYPEEVVLKKWLEGTVLKSLNEECAKILMIRGTRKRDDGTLCFNRDYKLNFDGFDRSYSTKDDLYQAVDLIKCPYFILKAKETKVEKLDEQLEGKIQALERNCRGFRVEEVEGAHHVIMTHPELVAKKLKPFLEKHDL